MNNKILFFVNLILIIPLSSLESGKIVFFETNPHEVEAFNAYFEGEGQNGEFTSTNLIFTSEKLNDSNVSRYKSAEIISISFSQVPSTIIDQLPNLKLIAARSTGYDHIDHAHASSKKVSVANVPNYASQSVAEFTFGLILNLSHKICEHNRTLTEKLDFNSSFLPGFDLKGKTLGVIGTGNIGKSVIRIAQGFQMNILACSDHPDNDFAAINNVAYVPLKKLLQESDIVTLHTALNEDTHHIIDEETLKLVKKDALLINTARGELVATKPLIKALKNGALAGAGLDVLECEHALSAGELASLNHELIGLPQVIVTPHIAYNSVDASKLVRSITAQNIINFIRNKPTNIVRQ